MLGVQEHAARLRKVVGEIGGAFVSQGWPSGGLGLTVGLILKEFGSAAHDAVGSELMDQWAQSRDFFGVQDDAVMAARGATGRQVAKSERLCEGGVIDVCLPEACPQIGGEIMGKDRLAHQVECG